MLRTTLFLHWRDLAKNLFPGDADRSFPIQFIEPPIQFLPLGVRQWDCFGRRRETLPKLI